MSTPQLQWRPTNAARVRRHDDIWFLDANRGWAVNSDGKVIKTENGGESWQEQFHAEDVYFRCIAFSNEQTGWLGTTTPATRLFRTRDAGETWTPVSGLPVVSSFICGLSVVNESVIYGSGTNDPGNIPGVATNIPGVIKSTDGGETWTGFDLSEHANLLVDIYFPDPDRGFVVGGKADVPNPTTRGRVKPVVLFTEDGGLTWTNLLADMMADLPRGEWGWKIFFVNDQVGYVSLENFTAGAVLKTTDGGRTWVRKPINDQQGNANLEGIGFIDENKGWVGGWGNRFFTAGFSSATDDGANNWRDANEIGRFINRFRFIGDPVAVGYASGDTIYKYSSEPVPAPIARTPAFRLLAADEEEPVETTLPVEIIYTVPAGAQKLVINVWNRFGVHVARPIYEQNPNPGPGSFSWNLEDDSGAQLEPGYYIYRVTIDDDSESRVIRVTSPTEQRPPMNRPTSFRLHIRPMFRDLDVQHMNNVGPFSIDLNDHAAVAASSQQILDRLKNPDDPMPPVSDDGPWPQEWISLFERWIAEGHPA